MKKLGYYCGDVNPKNTKSLGIYKFTKCLLKELIKQSDFEIILFVTKDNINFFDEFRCKKFILKKTSKNRIINRLWLDQIEINKSVKKENIDIIFFPKGILPLHKIKGIKYAAFIHDLIPLYYVKNKNFKFLPVSLFLLNSIKKADILFTNSKYSKSQIQKWTNKNIVVVPEGCNQIKEKEVRNIKIPYFFIIGNKNPHKNLNKSIKLFKEYNKLQRDKYNFIYTTGKLTDQELAWLYKKAKVSLFLSDIEGFGLPFLESYNYETPVVFNNKTSLKEIGEGLKGACNINNKESVFKAIDEVLKMKRSEILKIKKNLNKKYNWKDCAKKIINELKLQK